MLNIADQINERKRERDLYTVNTVYNRDIHFSFLTECVDPVGL